MPSPGTLHWWNPPARWSLTPGGTLLLCPDADTDFWQRTHYGFQHDNGHCLFAEVAGDFILTTTVRFRPAHRYDQAGLMVRLSADCWLKTSVEYEPDGPAKLGAVVTNHGYSDWSTQNFTAPENRLSFRIRREGPDYTVETRSSDGEPWVQLRIAHLAVDDGVAAVQAGLYACSPIDAGYEAEFEFLSVEPGRL